MRIIILAIIGLFSYLIIAIPGYFFLVPRNDAIDEQLETVTEQILDEPADLRSLQNILYHISISK